MEYRLRYRDVPWFVAIGVLPGKIIGTFFIKPWLKFKRDWKNTIVRWCERFFLLVVILVVMGGVLALTNHLTKGGIDRIFSDIKAMTETAPVEEEAIVDLATPADVKRRNHR